ncbi:unnamed protein product [Calypogeia fissa]
MNQSAFGAWQEKLNQQRMEVDGGHEWISDSQASFSSQGRVESLPNFSQHSNFTSNEEFELLMNQLPPSYRQMLHTDGGSVGYNRSFLSCPPAISQGIIAQPMVGARPVLADVTPNSNVSFAVPTAKKKRAPSSNGAATKGKK